MIGAQRIAGIDFSLTATGVTIITQQTDGCAIHATTIRTTGKLTDPVTIKSLRLHQLALAIKHATTPVSLMLIEGCDYRGKGKLDRLWAGWWMTVAAFAQADIPVAVISPMSLKLAITGSNRADKSVMGGHIQRLWPALDYSNENESDAAGLAHLGAVRLGWDVPTLKRHQQVKAEWPPFGAGSAPALVTADPDAA